MSYDHAAYMKGWRAKNTARSRAISRAADAKRKGRKQKLTAKMIESRNRRRMAKLVRLAGRPKPDLCEVCLERRSSAGITVTNQVYFVDGFAGAATQC